MVGYSIIILSIDKNWAGVQKILCDKQSKKIIPPKPKNVITANQLAQLVV